jgi:hypothetical protein
MHSILLKPYTINSLPLGKAPGSDGIPAEFLHFRGTRLREEIQNLMDK